VEFQGGDKEVVIMKIIRTAVAFALAAGLLAALAQSASAAPKHHKHAAQPKVEYLRAAGSPK
jgi:ABC-type phosphate transport system substrate-binding protein